MFGACGCVWCVGELALLLCCERMLTHAQMPARIRQVLVARGYDEFKRPDGWPRPRLQSHVARSSSGRGGDDHRDSGASANNPERAGGNRKGKRRRRPHTPALESSGSEDGDVI